jgi:hypothetical protein
MNDTDRATVDAALPAAPEMAAASPELFTGLSGEENSILRAHLTSGWYKQSAVYPTLSEPWKETSAVLDDLGEAWWIRRQAEREAEAGQ